MHIENTKNKYSDQAASLLHQMRLDEKISMLSGDALFAMSGNERLGLPSYPTSDGPHGVKLITFGEKTIRGNVTCFPTATALANSFNRTLVQDMGALLADEAQKEGTGVCLAPAVNIKRHPLCGRNFEYYSEDPYVAAELGAAAVNGIQSGGVPACVKHFAVNNQEYRRQTVNAVVDERTMREIYLRVFENIVRQAAPVTMMCSYNKVNGTFMSENTALLTKILRDEWGYQGMVMSDWGAVHDRIQGVRAGLDLEMPGGMHLYDEALKEAVENGELTEEDIDTCVSRIIECILFIKENKKPKGEIDHRTHHELAVKMAEECMVLLKNDEFVIDIDGMISRRKVLPLEKNADICVIGDLADKFIYQGGGSSKVLNMSADMPLECLAEYAHGGHITYVRGYDSTNEAVNEQILKEAVETAGQHHGPLIVFMGLGYGAESEEYDRENMLLPENQTALLRELRKVNDQIIVVLIGGSPVDMAWDRYCDAVLYASLAGEGAGKALSEILFGDVCPSGKLAETFPLCLENTPAFLHYPGKNNEAVYAEGLYVGYRYYDKKRIPIKYSFGYGLSYTQFAYGNLNVSPKEIKETDTVTVSCDVTNIGTVAGKEIVQLYISDPVSTVDKPVKELKGFEKIELMPGETGTVQFILSRDAFSYYEERIQDWYVESGEYRIMIGTSVNDIQVEESIYIQANSFIPDKYTRKTLIGELKSDPPAYQYVQNIIKNMPAALLPGYDHPIGPMGMNKYRQRDSMEIGALATGSGSNKPYLSEEQVSELLNRINSCTLDPRS